MDQKSSAEKYRSNFLAIVSHELNTPLMGILGSLQLLEEQFPQEHENIPTLRRNAERLRERINNLLELSRADAGSLRVRLSEVDFENFIYLHNDVLSERVAKAGYALDCKVENDLPRACADPKRMSKVLESLVTNAIKFSSSPNPGDPQPRVNISLSMESASVIPREYIVPGEKSVTGLYLVVTVCSSQPSIGERPENFEQLFEPFSPWRDVDTRPKEGLGVELALAREVLIAHSGFIWATDPLAAGEGWVFRFALPVLSREDELNLIINSRLYNGWDTLAKISLLLIQPEREALGVDGSKVSELANQVQSLLFRSSD
jgi:two-component system, NarL family, sensor histidine kinase BarA